MNSALFRREIFRLFVMCEQWLVRWIHRQLEVRQVCKGAPWLIAEQALETPRIRQALSGRNPRPPEPNQQDLDFA